jgi:carbonic anhydrase
LKTYPVIREKLATGELRIHAWWFNIAEGGVYAYDDRIGGFVLIEEKASVMDYLPTLSH